VRLPARFLFALTSLAFFAAEISKANEREESSSPKKGPKLIKTRFDTATDEELRKKLLDVPEVGLDPATRSSNRLILAVNKAIAEGDHQVQIGSEKIDLKPLLEADLALHLAPRLMAQRPDLAGLPIRRGVHSLLGKETAENLQVLSRSLREHLEASIPKGKSNDPRPSPSALRTRLLEDQKKDEWLRPAALPALQQLLMAEGKPVRLLLVEVLSRIKGKESTEALALRCIFDLHSEVREAAVQALKARPRKEYAAILVESLRYPWHPAVCHAAEAIVALKMRESVPKLVSLLQEPDPSEPISVPVSKTKKQTVRRELVRVNHLGNCLLCHAHSLATSDLVRGMVPVVGETLPAPVTSPSYYTGDGKGRRRGSFVRADVTYLRQHFSVYQPVEDPGQWPAYQRYDYLVRVRALSKALLARLKQSKVELEADEVSPHKQVLFSALRELTGKDLGSSVEAWAKAFGRAELKTKRPDDPAQDPTDKQVARLSSELVKASSARQVELIRLYQQRKGLVYTDALARAIAKLSGNAQRKARDALAARLGRMNIATLRDKFQDESAEVRRAAVLAWGKKGSSVLTREVIDLLNDPEASVRGEAHEALKQATGEDFGPALGATRAERVKAIDRWKKWWRGRE
jgi:HEAT repeat protein